MVSTQKQQIRASTSYKFGGLENSRAREFISLCPNLFTGSDLNEYPQEFIDNIYRVLRFMHASVVESVELESFRLLDVAILWSETWGEGVGDRMHLQLNVWIFFRILFSFICSMII